MDFATKLFSLTLGVEPNKATLKELSGTLNSAVLTLAEKQKALEKYAESAEGQTYIMEAPKAPPKEPVVWQISQAKIKELQWKRAQLRQFEREKATHTKTAPLKAPPKAPPKAPSIAPSKAPSKVPSKAPPKAPSKTPPKAQSKAPSEGLSKAPSKAPSKATPAKSTEAKSPPKSSSSPSGGKQSNPQGDKGTVSQKKTQTTNTLAASKAKPTSGTPQATKSKKV